MNMLKYAALGALSLTLVACGDDAEQKEATDAAAQVEAAGDVVEDKDLGYATPELLEDAKKVEEQFLQESNQRMLNQYTAACDEKVHANVENLSPEQMFTAAYVECLESEKATDDEKRIQNVIEEGFAEEELDKEAIRRNELFDKFLEQAKQYL